MRSGRREQWPVRVLTPQPGRLLALLRRHGFAVRPTAPGELRVDGTTAEELTRLAHFFSVPLQDLSRSRPPWA